MLSGKFTRPGGVEAGTRVSPDSLSARDHAAAKAVQEVAVELGVTPAQVAIAWTRARSRAVHPIIGARIVGQFEDNLGALEVRLPDDAVHRLDAATDFTLGFPADFIAQTEGGCSASRPRGWTGGPDERD